jgi:glycosyltransferase involved in cell wall biosynthesis
MVDYIEETILSVINQKNKKFEYLIIDGGSTDGSVEIIKRYSKHLSYWVSEPDKGMYHAIQKGFERSNGDLMGWINADDILLPGCLDSVTHAFSNNSCLWVRGLNAAIDYQGRVVNIHRPKEMHRYYFLNHECFSKEGQLVPYGTLQQEGTFWKRELWDKVDGLADNPFRLAGDFFLWMKFYRHSKPSLTNCLHGAFRWRTNQLSAKGRQQYEREMREIISAEHQRLTNKQRRTLSLYRIFRKIKPLQHAPYARKFFSHITQQHTIA